MPRRVVEVLRAFRALLGADDLGLLLEDWPIACCEESWEGTDGHERLTGIPPGRVHRLDDRRVAVHLPGAWVLIAVFPGPVDDHAVCLVAHAGAVVGMLLPGQSVGGGEVPNPGWDLIDDYLRAKRLFKRQYLADLMKAGARRAPAIGGEWRW